MQRKTAPSITGESANVSSRTSDILVEEPAIAVAVDRDEATTGGHRSNDLRESIGTIRAQLSGESDGDGASPLGINSLKARKRKGERVKFAPSADNAPWTKIERPSMQHGALKPTSDTATEAKVDGIEAGCILPLLRQLHSATSEGDPDSVKGSLNQEREVWTCGQNSYGELGHSDTRTRKVHCFVKPFQGKEIVDIAAGNEHTVLLCRTGEVYTAGYNDNGQCGQGTTQRIGELTRVPIVAGRKAVQVHAYNGCEHTIVVMDDGRMVSFGYNYRGQLGHGTTSSEPMPKPVRGLDGLRVTQVSCSYYHSIVACNNGEVYTFGRNDFGQLSSGDTIDRKLPCLVESLRGQIIMSLACGQYHTVVSTLQVGVQSCGKNDYGQLGLKTTEHQPKFVAVKGALHGAQVRHLRCGYYHTIVLAARDNVFGFGRNDYGQLGLGHTTQRVFGPHKIEGVEGKGVSKVSAGCYHTVLIGSDGMLFVFGRNHHGQLGTGDTNERHSPFPVSTFLGKRVAKVAAGFYHTIILTGGGKEELLDHSSVEAEDGLSPYHILNHPALSLPQNAGEVTAEARHEEDGGPAGDNVSLEMTSPTTTDQEIAAATGRPAHETLSNAVGSKVRHKPEGGICHGEERISGWKAAVFIMANMDRLIKDHAITPGCIPIIGHADTGGCDDKPKVTKDGNGEENGSYPDRRAKHDRDMYTVDVSPDTFELLADIIASISGGEQFSSCGGEEEIFQPYILLAALRLLKVNLMRLIQSDISTRIAESMLAKPPFFDLEDANELRLDGKLGFDPVLYTPLFDSTSRGQGNSTHQHHHGNDRHTSTENTDGCSTDVERYRTALYNIQRGLILLLQSDSSYGEGGGGGFGVESVRKEAAVVLVSGLELFFPGPIGQFCLLSRLISLAASDEDDARDMLFDGGSHNIDNTIRGPRAARHYILNPLLRRLCDDALVSKFIPYGAGAANKGSVCMTAEALLSTPEGSKVKPPSARLLDMQVTMLVDLMVQGGICTTFSGETFAYGSQEASPMSVLQLNGSATNRTESFDLDAGTPIDALGDGSDSPSLTQRLLVELVLMFMKHVLHWAGSERVAVDCAAWQSRVLERAGTDTDECKARPARLDEGSSMTEADGWFAARVKAFCNHATSVVLDGQNFTPPSWHCLINLAKLIMKYSVSVLEAALEKNAHRSDDRDGGDEMKASLHDGLQETLVGLLLPAVVTGLLPFAHLPVFARSLMDFVDTTVGLLDDACSKCSITRLADEKYIAARNGGSEASRNKRKPQTSFMRGENGKLGGGGTAGRNGNVGAGTAEAGTEPGASFGEKFDTANLPWLLSLAKTTAILAGRMAATIVVGCCGISPFLEHYFRSPIYSSWLESDLFKGGCDPSYDGLMLEPLETSSRDEFVDLEVPVAGNSCKPLPTVPISPAKGSRDKLDGFLEDIACGKGQGGRLVAWLARAGAPSNAAYRIIKHQARKGRDGIALERVERAMLAAMLRHGGLDGDAALFSASLKHPKGGQNGLGGINREPPRRLTTLWKLTAETAAWLWHVRSKLRSQDADQPSVDALFVEATNSCLVLMLLRPVGRVPPALMPKKEQQGPLSRAPRPVLQLAARFRWRKVIVAIRAMIRWRSVVTDCIRKETVAAVPRFVRAMLRRRANTKRRDPLGDRGGVAVTHDDGSVGCLSVLLVLVLDNHQRAFARLCGIRTFCALVGLVRTRSILADILLPLAPAMQAPHLVDRHILSHLSSVGDGVLLGVTKAFRALLSEVAKLLEQSCRTRDGESEGTFSSSNAQGSIITWHELTRARGCKGQMPSWFDHHTILALLEIWGLTVRPEDWEFLAAIGVMRIVSRVAAAPFAMDGYSTVEDNARSERCGDPTREDEGFSRNVRATQRREKASPLDQRCRPVATCRAAAWTLFRALTIQLHGIALDTGIFGRASLDVRPIMQVLRTELTSCVAKRKSQSGCAITDTKSERGGRRGGAASRQHRDRTPSQAILEFATPMIGGFPDSPSRGRGTAAGKIYGVGASHKRRSQELVSGPRRLMNMEDGLTFPAEHVLSNPRGSDFSITFWLLLAQDRTGHHRTVLARGYGSERWPVLLLRNTDNRLEVCFGIPSMGNLCERLTSKESVQVNSWVHVGLISEHNKLRLYFNGALDCQRTCSATLRANRHPLYVGKVPEGAMRLDGVRGGVEGSIANLRFFTRALSPIHVRILCDPGPPETIEVEDRHLYHLCACLVPISRSPQCRHHLRQTEWVHLFFQVLTYGTSRVQQSVCRILREVLPYVPPTSMAGVFLSTSRPRVVAAVTPPLVEGLTASEGQGETPEHVAFVDYLLRLVGASSWCTGAIMPSADWTRPTSREEEEATDMTIEEVLLRKQVMRFLPSTITQLLACGSQQDTHDVGVESEEAKTGRHNPSADPAALAHHAAPPLSAGTVRDVHTVGLEMVALVQTLAGTELWAETVALALRKSLARLMRFVDFTAGSDLSSESSGRDIDLEYITVDDLLSVAGGEAALHVLGGGIDLLCAGAYAKVLETEKQCIVLGVDQATSTAYVILHPEERAPAADKWVQRFSIHDLEVQTSDSLCRGAMLALSTGATESLHEDGTMSGHAYITGVATHFLRSAPLPRLSVTSGTEHLYRAKTANQELMLAQCRSRIARVVLRASQDFEWACGAVQGSDIFTELLRVAILPRLMTTGPMSEASLAEMENIALQERLHQMLGTSGGADIVANKIAEMSSNPGEGAYGKKYELGNTQRGTSERDHVEVDHHRSVSCSTEASWTDGLACPFCHEEMTTASSIFEHVLAKHSTDMRRMPCPVCVSEKGDDTAHDLPTHLELVHFETIMRDRRSFLPTSRDGRRELAARGRFEGRPPSHLVEQLMVIGFPEDWCAMALRENHNDVVNASAWIVDNLDMLSSLNNLHPSSPDNIDDVGTRTTAGGSPGETDRPFWRGAYGFGRDGLARREIRQHGNNQLGLESRCVGAGAAEGEQKEKYQEVEEGDSHKGPLCVVHGFDQHQQHTTLPPPRSALDNALGDDRHVGVENDQFTDGPVVSDRRDSYFPVQPALSRSPGGSSRRIAGSCLIRSHLAAVNLKITGMELCQLTEEWLNSELQLTMMYCRAALINLLLRWPQRVPMCTAAFGSAATVVRLTKKVLFSGQELPVTFTDEDVCGSVIRPLPNGARRPNVLGVFAPLLAHLLSFERNGHSTSTPSTVIRGETVIAPKGQTKTAVGTRTQRDTMNEPAKHWQDTLSARLVSTCLDGLDVGSAPDQFAEVPWVTTESPVSSTPSSTGEALNLELIQWLLDLLLSVNCADIFTENAFSRLSNCLKSPTVAAKETAMYALTSIATKWCESLAVEIEHDSRDAVAPTPVAAALPSPLAMEDTFQRHMAVSRVRSALVKRIAVERRPRGLFFTRYTQILTALYAVMCKLQRLLLLRRQNSVSSELSTGVDFTAEKVETPTILYCTDASVAVTWLPLRKMGSSSGIMYEVQMATRQLGADGRHDVFRRVYSGKRLRCRVEDLMPGQAYRFRLRAVHPTAKVTAWSAVVTAETEQGVAFRFDSVNSGPAILVSGNELSATFRSNETWSTILGTTPFCTGSNYWELHLDKSATSYIFIGVATRDADLTTFLGGDDHGWGFIGDRALYHKRSKVKAYGERFSQGDTVGVTLNMDRRTLSFSKNGQDLGVAFEGLVGNLYPAVAFYNQGQRISLVQSAFRCPGAGVTVLSSPLNTMPEEVLELQEVMEAMVSTKQLPSGWMEAARAGHLTWIAGETIRYATILDFELQFDVSDSSCRRFGLRARGRVRTPRGNATVIGACEGVMWFHVDGERGAWFFTAGEIWQGKKTGCFVMSAFDGMDGENDGGTPRRMAVDGGRAEEPGKAEGTRIQGSTGVAKGQMKGPGDAAAGATSSQWDFAAVGNCARWTPAVDGCIVASLCEYADRHQVSVWNLTPAQVLRTLTSARKRLDTLLTSDTAVSDSDLLCRVSVLKHYNHALLGVLPFADTAQGVQVSGHAESRTFIWGTFNASRGLAVGVGDHPTRGLGPLLVRLRRSTFLATKQQALSQAVSITTTHAKKAEDEYDYPEDLPQLTVNRLKAAAGQESMDPYVRLKTSVFHQLFQELHTVDASLLRMGYTHPMDDGQQRTFKVKFEGEGVDDYGGPYREIFTQVAVELTSTVPPSPQLDGLETTAAVATSCESGSGTEYLLPVLEPTASSASDGGDVGVEFMVRANIRQQRYLRFYTFLGQLMGIALRCRVTVPWRLSQIFWKGLVGEGLLETDLSHIDSTACGFAQEIRSKMTELGGTESESAETPGVLTWTEALRSKTVESKPGGGEAIVESFGLTPHLGHLVHTCLHQSDASLFAVRDGFASVVPAAVLPLFTWKEVELQVCGRPGVDMDLLEANTEYDDDISLSDAHIQSFWRVLRAFDDRDRCQFLRFVWARSRLPRKTADFHQKFKIHSPTGQGARENPDQYLPKAHTCFFSINLPRYSSDEIMAKQLRYTMYNCIEMDADFRLADNEMPGWENEAAARGSRGGQSGSSDNPSVADQLS
ncbi:unnamed protein product [Scytosiphon promiscuus]